MVSDRSQRWYHMCLSPHAPRSIRPPLWTTFWFGSHQGHLEAAVVPLGPDMLGRFRIDELGGDPQPAASPPRNPVSRSVSTWTPATDDSMSTNEFSIERNELQKQETETRSCEQDGDTNTALSVNEDRPGGKSPFYHV